MSYLDQNQVIFDWARFISNVPSGMWATPCGNFKISEFETDTEVITDPGRLSKSDSNQLFSGRDG